MDETRKYLAYGLAVGAFLILGFILWISRDQKELIFAMLTGMLSILGTLAGFYFGSTEGSQAKTAIIKDLTGCSEDKK